MPPHSKYNNHYNNRNNSGYNNRKPYHAKNAYVQENFAWRIGAPPIESLEEDINLFYSWIKPTKEEVILRQCLFHKISKIIRSCCGENCQPIVFGSMACNLYLPTSDIDIAVMYAEGGHKSWIHKLAECFSTQDFVRDLKVLPEARVPVIKFFDTQTSIGIDICFDVENGISNTKVVNDLMIQYTKLEPLLMIIKYLLLCCGCNEVYQGGIGSYALVLMVVGFFQQKYVNNTANQQPLSELLQKFLQYFGMEFNYYVNGISVKDGTLFEKVSKGWQSKHQPYLLSLEDPNNSDNDVAKCSYKILYIKELFFNCSRCLEYANQLVIFQVHPMFLQIRKNIVSIVNSETFTRDTESPPPISFKKTNNSIRSSMQQVLPSNDNNNDLDSEEMSIPMSSFVQPTNDPPEHVSYIPSATTDNKNEELEQNIEPDSAPDPTSTPVTSTNSSFCNSLNNFSSSDNSNNNNDDDNNEHEKNNDEDDFCENNNTQPAKITENSARKPTVLLVEEPVASNHPMDETDYPKRKNFSTSKIRRKERSFHHHHERNLDFDWRKKNEKRPFPHPVHSVPTLKRSKNHHHEE